MSVDAPLPQYFVYYSRPLKLFRDNNGALRATVLSYQTGAFEPGDELIDEVLHTRGGDVRQVDEAGFHQQTERLRGQRLRGDDIVFALYAVINAIEQPALRAYRPFKPWEQHAITSLREQTSILFEIELLVRRFQAEQTPRDELAPLLVGDNPVLSDAAARTLIARGEARRTERLDRALAEVQQAATLVRRALEPHISDQASRAEMQASLLPLRDHADDRARAILVVVLFWMHQDFAEDTLATAEQIGLELLQRPAEPVRVIGLWLARNLLPVLADPARRRAWVAALLTAAADDTGEQVPDRDLGTVEVLPFRADVEEIIKAQQAAAVELLLDLLPLPRTSEAFLAIQLVGDLAPSYQRKKQLRQRCEATLTDVLLRGDPVLWWRTTQTLAALGNGWTTTPAGTEAISRLITALESPDGSVSTAAAMALGETGDTRAVEPLQRAIATTPHDQTRWQAAKALKRLAPDWVATPAATAVVPALLAIVADQQHSRNGRRFAAAIVQAIAEQQRDPALAAQIREVLEAHRRTIWDPIYYQPPAWMRY